MKIYKDLMAMGHNFNVWDVAVLKAYLLAVAALLAIIFPVLLAANVRVYVVLFVAFYAYAVNMTRQKEGNYFKKLIKGDFSWKPLQKYTMMDMGVLKMTMILFGLMIIKIFPVVLTINIAWYIGVFAFGLGYFVAKMCTQK